MGILNKKQPGPTDTFQKFDLIQRRLCERLSALHHLQSHKTPLPAHKQRQLTTIMFRLCDACRSKGWNPYLHHIPAEPHSREVTPSQLFNHLVAVNENLPNLHVVVTTCNTRVHRLHQREDLTPEGCWSLVFLVLPTCPVVCRTLLLLIIRSQRLGYLSSWRAVEGGRFRTPCCVWGGPRAGFKGRIRRAGCVEGWYSSSVWRRHVWLEPDEFQHSWRGAPDDGGARGASFNNKNAWETLGWKEFFNHAHMSETGVHWLFGS